MFLGTNRQNLHFFAAVWWIASREWRRLTADARLRSVVFIAPLAYSGLFCAVYFNHGVEEVPIAVVQLDHSQATRTLLRMLEASPKLHVVEQLQDIEQLRDRMYRQEVLAGLVITKDFARRLRSGQDVTVPTYINAGSMVDANTVGTAVNRVIQTFSAGVEIRTLMKKGLGLRQAHQAFMPVKMDLRPLFNPSYNYTNFMIPGLLFTLLQQVILLGLALTWTSEKEEGSISQLFGSTNSNAAVLIGKSLPYLLIHFVMAEVFLRIVFPLNDIPMEGSWKVAIGFTMMFILSIVTWGLWMSAFCRTRLFATQMLMFLATPSFVLSGFTYPQSAMPEWVQWLAQLFPMSYFVTSFRNVYLGGASLSHIWPNFMALGLFVLINSILAYLAIGWLRNHSLRAV